MGTKKTKADDRLAAALFPKARREVLGLFLGRAGEAFYLREVVDRTDLGLGSVQRELARLAGAGLLRRSVRGRNVYFQADERCPGFDELRALVLRWSGTPRVARVKPARRSPRS